MATRCQPPEMLIDAKPSLLACEMRGLSVYSLFSPVISNSLRGRGANWLRL